MIDFPIDDLMDEEARLHWLGRHLHPAGLKRPHCGTRQRRVAPQNGDWPARRRNGCDHSYTLLGGTVFEKTRPPPSKVVLLVRGSATGEATARVSGEWGIGRVRGSESRQRIQRNLLASRPNEPLPEDVLEADERGQNAGEKRQAAPPPGRPAAKARSQAARARNVGNRSSAALLGPRPEQRPSAVLRAPSFRQRDLPGGGQSRREPDRASAQP